MSAETLPVAPLAKRSPKDPKATEGEVLDLLERMHAKSSGNGPEYAFMRQVRNGGGFEATRSFDAVAVSLWPSRGYEIHIFEVKVSRSDWQRELDHPRKAEDAAKLADRYTIVAPRDVVPEGEVPATWGLIHITGGTEVFDEEPPYVEGMLPTQVRRVEGRKIRRVRKAPLLHPGRKAAPDIARSFVIPMLRAAGATPEAVPASERQIRSAVDDAVTRERERAAREAESWRESRHADQELLNRFTNHSGLVITARNVEDQGKRVKVALLATPDTSLTCRRLTRVADDLASVADNLRRQVVEMHNQT